MSFWETEQQKRDREARESSGIWATIFLFIILVVPVILAKILGFIVGIFLKLGFVGKIVLTVLFVVFVLLSLTIIGAGIGIVTLSSHDSLAREILEGVILLVLLGISVFLGIFWFWRKHYHTLKNMTVSEFSELVKICFAICFYGSIVLVIIFGITDKEHLMGLAFGIPFLIAIIYWLIITKNYQGVESSGQVQAVSASTVSGSPSADMRWARWSEDGNLYYVTSTSASGNGVKVCYYDGSEEELNKNDIFSLSEAINSGYTPHGNWQGQGSFYPCNILKTGADTVLVKYTQDGVEEALPYEGLVFLA